MKRLLFSSLALCFFFSPLSSAQEEHPLLVPLDGILEPPPEPLVSEEERQEKIDLYHSGDPFDPVDVMPDGPIFGLTVDTQVQRKLVILPPEARVAFGVGPKEILVANFTHFKNPPIAGQHPKDNVEHYIAAIPLDGVRQLAAVKSAFNTQTSLEEVNRELLAHVQFKFRFDEGNETRLLLRQSQLIGRFDRDYRKLGIDDWEEMASLVDSELDTIGDVTMSFEAAYVREKELSFYSDLIIRDALPSALRFMSHEFRMAQIAAMKPNQSTENAVTTTWLKAPWADSQEDPQHPLFVALFMNALIEMSAQLAMAEHRYNLFTYSCHTIPFELIDTLIKKFNPKLLPNKFTQQRYFFKNDGERAKKLRAELVEYITLAKRSALERDVLESEYFAGLTSATGMGRNEILHIMDQILNGPETMWERANSLNLMFVTSPVVEALPTFLIENLKLRKMIAPTQDQ